ncbi:Peptidase family M23 [Pustulibacterium marinum]|uniref:Peptidase family M23 n=1 Tax=Pustulibacterium marinum TaxID=1224947 RepID=A0A1I7FR00_9FLAO|nr:peptidoglycan DD-metalloendopeptidase family protein [Pustulibacterium marinum]SFU38639.1 Peptidase family M23 [Pustulibacterium marinum]
MNTFLNSISKEPLCVVDDQIPLSAYTAIQINSSNKDLEQFDIANSKDWEKYIDQFLKDHNCQVAFGGYLEERDIYDRSSYFKNTEEKRNTHLGIDLWCNAGTAVLSVLDGEIHSFQNNKNFGDYGPTIIIKHTIQNYVFYSLYGHLSEESLVSLNVGDTVKQGEKIAQLGKSLVNGDYAPHLHFQIIIDMQDKEGDYPGVCSRETLEFYKENCPDPNVLLKLY